MPDFIPDTLALFTSYEAWISLLTLSFLEIVLGVDNIVFISVLAAKLPPEQQPRARKLGLALALITRLLLLFCLSLIMKLTAPLFEIGGMEITGKSIILFLGGAFLLVKGTIEIHDKLEGVDGGKSRRIAPTFTSVILQIMILDVVFSLDSVITAVGMVEHIAIMVIAIVISMIVMLLFIDRISAFIENHPTMKILALSFLILIGFVLVTDALLEEGIPKGYIYFAMFFSFGVELLNMRLRRKGESARLKRPYQ